MSQQKLCSINNCDRPSRARNMCVGHYRRWSKYGDPEYVIQRVNLGQTCSVDGCDSDAHQKGLCVAHFFKQRRHGDPLWTRKKTAARR